MEPGHRSLTIEYITTKLWVSANFQAALSGLQRCLPKWVRNGFVLMEMC
jgi:hypothetical protein